MTRIGIVAGEASGDAIAADFILKYKNKYPNTVFEGIAGPKMKAAGCVALYDSERLAVMAITEVIGRLFELLHIRKKVIAHFLQNPPDIFIGVDAPDFNLALERKLKSNNILTAHYVSPSVWAWRQYRVKKIKKSVDLMLTLFPFEADFYRKHKVPVEFIGHPMADEIGFDDKRNEARFSLSLDEGIQIVALLPGSRTSEVDKLLPLMLQTADLCLKKNNEENPKLRFLIPAATSTLYKKINQLVSESDISSHVRVENGNARTVMQAADVILLASGTATLEAMLLNKPMIVTYKVSPLSYRVMKLLSNVQHISLPNFFTHTQPVPEFIQDDATAENIASHLMALLSDKEAQAHMCKTFRENHNQLRKDASGRAVETIAALILKNKTAKG